MPTPDSDIDDQLRAAMKVLDDEVPSGYFEALPNLTLARLEGTSMQQGTSGSTTKQTTSAPPPVATPPSATDNTEDSGLHDIRNLAQSTKQRLSSKRITTSPPVDDDIASSSAGWKAVALPQPAKMVALPALEELPSKKEIKAAEKAAAKVQKVAEVAADDAAAKAAVDAPAPVPVRQAFSLPSAQKKKSKAPLIALVGLGVAAAAGAAIFVTTQKNSDKASTVAVAQNTAPAAAPTTVTVAPIGGAAGSAAVSGDVQKAQDEVAKAQAEADAMRAQLAAEPPADKAAGTTTAKAQPVKAVPVPKKGHGTSKVDTGIAKPQETKPVDTTKTDKTDKTDKKVKNADGSEPDFNDLLKEAGVDQNKHEAKPKLEKKSLTGDDFKSGMSAVTSKAQGCYKGTQGTATVKLVIAPSGKIAKITVGGAFAGKPEATCVAAAIRGATFPAWDGGPMSFTYPILLSE